MVSTAMSAALALDVLGGLVLFLFGVLQLATGVEALAADRARTWLARWTAHPLTGVATGAVATTVLDSSSVSIILVIALVNAGLGLVLLHPLGIAAGMLPGGDQLPRQIANAHVLFNVTGVLLFLPFTSAIAAILPRTLPDRTEERKTLDLADQDGPAGATEAT